MPRAIGGPYVEHVFGEAVQEQLKGHLGWATAEVSTSIAWPLEDTLVRYDGEDYFLRGTGDDHSQQPCLTVRTSASQTDKQAVQKMYRFGSVLGWYLNGYVDVGGYVTGSHPMRYGRVGAERSGLVMGKRQKFNCNYLPLIPSEEARKALAFWREGQRLYRVHDAYSFLSFYKVLDSQFTKSKAKAKATWIDGAISKLEGEGAKRVAELKNQGLDVSVHIRDSCRHAVAHASIGEVIVDPDLIEDRLRIFKDIDVMRGLAQLYIREALQMPTNSDVYRERDRLIPLHKYLKPGLLERIKTIDAVSRRSLNLDGRTVAVSIWPNSAPLAFKNLSLSVLAIRNGVAHVKATNSRSTLTLVFYFDFIKGEAHAAIDENFASSSDVEASIATLEFFRDVIANKTAEIALEDGQKVQCKVVIPVNIDPGRTFDHLESEISALRARLPSDAT